MTTNNLSDDLWERIPRPILPKHPLWEKAYYAAWAQATSGNDIHNQQEPLLLWEAGLVPQWLSYAPDALGGHPADLLDRFYAHQRKDGALPIAHHQSEPVYTDSPTFGDLRNHSNPASLNPFLPLAWPEWELAERTGDYSRLERVVGIIASAFDWETNAHGRKQGYLCWNPPGPHPWHHREAYGWADYTAMAAVQCEFLSNIALLSNRQEIGEACAANYLNLKELATNRLWDDLKLGYLDVDEDELYISPFSGSTIWCLFAGFPDIKQKAELLKHLRNHRTLGRPHPVPSIAPPEKEFSLKKGHFYGAVHPTLVYLAIQALLRLKEYDLAGALAIRNLEALAIGFDQTQGFWNGYHPDRLGEPVEKSTKLSQHEVPLGPVATLLSAILGFTVEGEFEELHYRPALEEDHGIENLRLGQRRVSVYTRWKDGHWHGEFRCDGPAEIHIHSSSGTKTLHFTKADSQKASFQ